LTEGDTLERVKSKQGILSKIQNFFTLGYGTKEDLRELDKKLRDTYYSDLRDARHVWEDVYLAAMEAGLTASSSDFKKIIQVLDRVMEKIRHANYGYAGLMDRKGHIREVELTRVFDYDRTLSNAVKNVKTAMNETYKQSEAEQWTDISSEVKRIKNLIRDLENSWRERENQFRPLEV
jgi:5-methylthioribose kinase